MSKLAIPGPVPVARGREPSGKCQLTSVTVTKRRQLSVKTIAITYTHTTATDTTVSPKYVCGSPNSQCGDRAFRR